MYQLISILSFTVLVSSAAFARAEPPSNRPDPNANPIATCKLQSIDGLANARESMPPLATVYSIQPPPDDPLVHYERTPLGDWPEPAEADRNDPWLRLLLFAPTRPVVVDLAVFIDGKSFRHARDAWIDDVLAATKESTADAASKIAAPADSNGAEADSQSAPNISAQSRQAPTMRARLLSYLAAAGGEVDRKEIRWLNSEWGSGPAVVVLGASQTWQRAGLAPLLTYLDQDADGALSAEEISHANARLQQADLDGDDAVELTELRRATKLPAVEPDTTGHSLVVLLDANTDLDATAASFARVYDESAEAANERLLKLSSGPADVTLRADFAGAATSEKGGQALSLFAVSPDHSAADESIDATTDVIVMDLGGATIEFSAAQAPAGEVADVSTGQLAIGAVIDGNPLLRLLDANQDGRLTLRERNELPDLLKALDRNSDGQIAAAEIPVPIRLAVTLGAHVHRLLAKPTGAARTIAPRVESKAPDWFVSMDKNTDGDVARSEFLGTTEQFRQFDANGDELLSAAEALQLNPGK